MLESQGNPNISKSTGWPRKCFYRAWTHTNPLIDSHFPVPLSPSQVDYLLHFPQISPSSSENGADTKKVEFADIDTEELGGWMKTCLENHPLFEALTEEELEADPVVKLLDSATEEGQKVAWNGGQTYWAVYRLIASTLQLELLAISLVGRIPYQVRSGVFGRGGGRLESRYLGSIVGENLS
ncbi:hypothetical protein Ancab_010318 [Ancistrocladus abbreviatus]